MLLIRLWGLQMPLRNGFGAYFWCSLFDVDVFTAMLLYFYRFLTSLGSIFGGLGPPESFIFIERVVILEVFVFLLLILFFCPFGQFWVVFWMLLGSLGVLGAASTPLGEGAG